MVAQGRRWTPLRAQPAIAWWSTSVDDVLAKTGMAVNGEKVVIISGSPPGIPGTTDEVRVHVVGEVL